jgi:hypothetical protein
MSPLLPVAALAVFYFIQKKEDDRKLIKGRAYVATFKLPPIAPTPEQLASVLPDGASIQPDGSNVVVTFNAPSNATIGDIPTPLGTIKLVSIRALADVIGASVPPPPSPYAFSWWYEKPGIGLVFSGWQGPQTLSWQDMNRAVMKLSATRNYVTALRWNGSKWEKSV